MSLLSSITKAIYSAERVSLHFYIHLVYLTLRQHHGGSKEATGDGSYMLHARTNGHFIYMWSFRQSHVIRFDSCAENWSSDTEFKIFNLEENRAKGV